MILLAIDCSANLCAACVYDAAAQAERGRCVLDIGKGHAERLVAVVEQALAGAGVPYADLGAIAVSVGPGSFTGIRVAVSAARGFALALGIPAIGVNTLEALAAQARETLGPVPVMVALASGLENIQAAVYDALGDELYAPAMMTFREGIDLADGTGAALAGAAAGRIAAGSARLAQIGPTLATADIRFYARIAAARGGAGRRPSPLYLREPDARPQAGFILARRGGA